MPRSGLAAAWVLAGLLLACPVTLAAEPRFGGPLTVADVPIPVALDTGDFNKDGKLDLVAVSGSGPPQILLQDPSDRTSWSRSPLQGISGGYFVHAADFDGDQDDLMVADPGSTAYFVSSRHKTALTRHPSGRNCLFKQKLVFAVETD